MPNNHLFTVFDSNLARSNSDLESRLFIPANDAKTSAGLSALLDASKIQDSRTQTKEMAQQKQSLRRPRSQTLPDITTERRNSTKRIETAGNLKAETPLRLTRSLELDSQAKNEKKAASPVRKRSRSLHTNQAKVSFDTALTTSRRSSMKETQKLNYTILSKERGSTDATNANRPVADAVKTRSFSIPNEDFNANSIYSIVKARSLALKWYRNGGGSNGKISRARRKKSVLLPTIMDEKKNISLCKAKCSPQFEQVVHWMRDEVDNIEDDIQVLSLE